KTMINKVLSPDISIMYSVNPYQGCEHGCIYCYARNTHPYWGYSAGIDFEQKIMIKQNAAGILRKELLHKNWKVAPVSFSGNTDCYQPAEAKFKLTRSMLEVMLELQHPVGIITKNSLITRDLDILKALNEKQLINVYISVTSMDEELRRNLEPRTATAAQRLKTIKLLSSHGIPVGVMLAPIIPGLNSHEIMEIAKRTSEAGALGLGYTIVRLNGQVSDIFKEWLQRTYPDRYEKVIHQIEEVHGGQVNDNRFGKRMRGEGKIADIIKDTMIVARRKYFEGKHMPALNTELFISSTMKQLSLF
ncbi:MAG TPA: PA0069 family radical SAM protein, partial [Saprospiraceae bacterium]|nr:PA0069 family radical SAM protein [Saprospiraceae bacterium]